MDPKAFKEYIRNKQRDLEQEEGNTPIFSSDELKEALAAMGGSGPILIASAPNFEYTELSKELEQEIQSIAKKTFSQIFHGKFQHLLTKIAEAHDPVSNLLDCYHPEDYFVIVAADIYGQAIAETAVSFATKLPKFSNSESQEKYEEMYTSTIQKTFVDIFPVYREDFVKYVDEMLFEEQTIAVKH